MLDMDISSAEFQVKVNQQWQSYGKIRGAKVIHDDRLILRKTASGYMMFNTPVYNNDEPNESPLNKIFLIEHGLKMRCTGERSRSCKPHNGKLHSA